MRDRILDIYATYGECIRRLVPLQVEDEYLKIAIYFADGSNLRVTEEWQESVLTVPLRTPDNSHWGNALLTPVPLRPAPGVP